METSSYKIIKYKPGELPEQYLNFIMATYLNSLRVGNDWFMAIDSDAYHETYSLLIEKMLIRPDVTVRIAVLEDEPDVALGWSIMRPQILDYVFVKKILRKNGIAKSLTQDPYTVITHITKYSEQIRNRKDTVFNPFI